MIAIVVSTEGGLSSYPGAGAVESVGTSYLPTSALHVPVSSYSTYLCLQVHGLSTRGEEGTLLQVGELGFAGWGRPTVSARTRCSGPPRLLEVTEHLVRQSTREGANESASRPAPCPFSHPVSQAWDLSSCFDSGVRKQYLDIWGFYQVSSSAQNPSLFSTGSGSGKPGGSEEITASADYTHASEW